MSEEEEKLRKKKISGHAVGFYRADTARWTLPAAPETTLYEASRGYPLERKIHSFIQLSRKAI